MKTFQESDLKITFSPDFEVISADKSPDILKLKRSVSHSSDVDFVALHAKGVFFIEVKNYRGVTFSESIDDLVQKIGRKLRDTIAAAVGGARQSTNDEVIWKKVVQKLQDDEMTIALIFVLEMDKSDAPKLSTITAKLKKRVNWLSGCKVFVLNSHKAENLPDGITLERLPRNLN